MVNPETGEAEPRDIPGGSEYLQQGQGLQGDLSHQADLGDPNNQTKRCQARWKHTLSQPPSTLHPIPPSWSTPTLKLAYSPSGQELHFHQDCQALPRDREQNEGFLYSRTVGCVCVQNLLTVSYLRASRTSISFGTIQTTETLREEREMG